MSSDSSGHPGFARTLHVGGPNIGNREKLMARFTEMLDRRWFSNRGPLVQEFEARIAEFVGVKNVICVCNATIGLEIAVRASDVSGEVIVPAYTFVATAHALQWQNITPVFADMDPRTYNLDPEKVERHLSPKTTAILATHLWGRPCAVEALEAIARKHGLKLIFDAAHAFACSHRGRRVGGFGLAEVFSFHATKFLNSFEGGAVCTNDDALAQRIRLMTNFGFEGFDRVGHVGTNGKMTEVCAAMGLTSLEAVDDLIALNRRNFELYRQGLASVDGVRLIAYDSNESNNYQYIVVELADGQSLSRDQLVAALHAKNVLARKYFWPGCHRMEPYRTLFPDAARLLPATERVAAQVIVLPTGQSIGPDEIHAICGIIRTALQNAPATGPAKPPAPVA